MTSQQPQKRQNKRRPSKEMQRVYLRRRIVVGVVALALLALIGFGIYTLATNVFSTYHGHGGASASSSASSKAQKGSASKKTGKSDNGQNNQANQSSVRKCGAKDVKLELNPASQSIGVGESLDFKATIRYEGDGSCLIDASNASRILTIYSISGNGSGQDSDSGSSSGQGSASKSGTGAKSKSGSTSGAGADSKDDAASSATGDTVWSSTVCPADPRNLLMAKGDKDVQKITWPTDSTGSTCVPDEQLPRVDRGTYLAQLSLKDHPDVKSEKVPVIVE
ncbi:hypothetical protein [Bifidobacterium sp. ESL0732]|uniref:hypothetical protein n=1 Tax=Bifidobacterium sp. ESL0732 TaxID=2983222 RepID=UPI0023F7E064|nr:hypothetical protein [Bifidobacterium sp. ESL0732]WEV64366.1 hypothetical protein OZX70_01870 [Bifidobacterium sp. ESL0732]